MRAVVVKTPGAADALTMAEIERPVVAPTEVLVKVHYAGCNWCDVQRRQGIYPTPTKYPAVLGGEIAGIVVARGKDVRSVRVGQPVMAMSNLDLLRAFAEYASVPEVLLIPLSDESALRAASALPIAALTAYHILHTAYDLKANERILIHAISGGVGLCLAQIAKEAGAIVYGTVGSRTKVDLPLKLGADRVIPRDSEDFVEAVMSATDGRGVDLVIDSLGAEILPRSFDALRYFGHLINIGEAAGEPEFNVRKTLYKRSTSMAGFEVLHAQPGSENWRKSVEHIMNMVSREKLVLPIAAEFRLEEIAKAQELLESRRTMGKVILKVW
jgi:NADPH:quinone reductase